MESAEIPEAFRLESYAYDLPEGLIAQTPSEARDGSRLMVVDRSGGGLRHQRFADIADHLREGDCLVVNETRVVPARLFARKETGGLVELLAIRTGQSEITAMYGTHRKLRTGAVLRILDRSGAPTDETVVVRDVHQGGTVEVDVAGKLGPGDLMREFGRVPVPPYIKREDDSRHELDCERYQTVYARTDGAVAAPTAGLHFTKALLRGLRDRGVSVARICLHVGPGTFKPITTGDLRDHRVGSERYFVDPRQAHTINRTVERGGRVIAVGTTAVRTLETVWDGRGVVPGEGDTDLYIVPGHRFGVVSGMVTNFHLPGSSLLVLVSAFAGRERVLDCYRTAVEMGYRFYSYGDAMLIV